MMRQLPSFSIALVVISHLLLLLWNPLMKRNEEKKDYGKNIEITVFQKLIEQNQKETMPQQTQQSNKTSGGLTQDNEVMPPNEPAQEEIIEQTAGDTTDSDLLNRYLAVLRQKVNEQKFYPPRARKLRQTGEVRIAFNVKSNGEVSKIQIITPANFEELNQAALKMIHLMGKAPPFFDGMKESQLRVEQRVQFKLPF